MIIPAEAERGTCHLSRYVTNGSTRIARKAASSSVMQKELAKKQKAMRRTSTMPHRSQAIRLNRRCWSKSVELRIIETSCSPSYHLQTRARDLLAPQLGPRRTAQVVHDRVLRWKKWTISERTANSSRI